MRAGSRRGIATHNGGAVVPNLSKFEQITNQTQKNYSLFSPLKDLHLLILPKHSFYLNQVAAIIEGLKIKGIFLVGSCSCH